MCDSLPWQTLPHRSHRRADEHIDVSMQGQDPIPFLLQQSAKKHIVELVVCTAS